MIIGKPIDSHKLLYQAYCYLHMYPNRCQSKSSLGSSRWKLNYDVIPAIRYLAQVMNEIHWEDRLSPYNHTPHFPLWFVGAVDTFPLRVLTPVSSRLRKALFNPKYGQVIKQPHNISTHNTYNIHNTQQSNTIQSNTIPNTTPTTHQHHTHLLTFIVCL